MYTRFDNVQNQAERSDKLSRDEQQKMETMKKEIMSNIHNSEGIGKTTVKLSKSIYSETVFGDYRGIYGKIDLYQC